LRAQPGRTVSLFVGYRLRKSHVLLRQVIIS
jgi:hypothetical protein